MKQPVRDVVYQTSYAYQLKQLMDSGLLLMPAYPLVELAELTQEMNATIAKAKANPVESFLDTGGQPSYVHSDQEMEKMSVKERKKAAKDDRDSYMAQVGGVLKDIMIETAKKHAEDMKNRIMSRYNNCVQAYNDTIDTLKYLYMEGGMKESIDSVCDDIDADFVDVQDLASNLVVHTSAMFTKVPTPGAIGTCVVNPVYGVQTLITDLKTIFSIIMQMIGKIKHMIKLIKYLYPFGDLISTLTDLINLIKSLKDTMQTINDGTDDIMNSIANMVTPCYECKFNQLTNKYEEDSLSGKIIGYKKPASVKATTTKVKTNWIDGDDSDGIALTTGVEVNSYNIYRDKDCQDFVTESTTGLFIESKDKNPNEATVEISEDGKHSILHLADGRKVTIDKIVKTGDIVKLNDGTIVTVK